MLAKKILIVLLFLLLAAPPLATPSFAAGGDDEEISATAQARRRLPRFCLKTLLLLTAASGVFMAERTAEWKKDARIAELEAELRVSGLVPKQNKLAQMQSYLASLPASERAAALLDFRARLQKRNALDGYESSLVRGAIEKLPQSEQNDLMLAVADEDPDYAFWVGNATRYHPKLLDSTNHALFLEHQQAVLQKDRDRSMEKIYQYLRGGRMGGRQPQVTISTAQQERLVRAFETSSSRAEKLAAIRALNELKHPAVFEFLLRELSSPAGDSRLALAELSSALKETGRLAEPQAGIEFARSLSSIPSLKEGLEALQMALYDGAFRSAPAEEQLAFEIIKRLDKLGDEELAAQRKEVLLGLALLENVLPNEADNLPMDQLTTLMSRISAFTSEEYEGVGGERWDSSKMGIYPKKLWETLSSKVTALAAFEGAADGSRAQRLGALKPIERWLESRPDWFKPLLEAALRTTNKARRDAILDAMIEREGARLYEITGVASRQMDTKKNGDLGLAAAAFDRLAKSPRASELLALNQQERQGYNLGAVFFKALNSKDPALKRSVQPFFEELPNPRVVYGALDKWRYGGEVNDEKLQALDVLVQQAEFADKEIKEDVKNRFSYLWRNLNGMPSANRESQENVALAQKLRAIAQAYGFKIDH